MNSEGEKEDLNKNIIRLTKALEKQNSPKRVFLMAVISGVGGVIGATVVAGILFVVLLKFIPPVEQIPVVGDYVKALRIESSIMQRIKLEASSPTPTP